MGVISINLFNATPGNIGKGQTGAFVLIPEDRSRNLKPRILAEPILVGRVQELEELEQNLDEAIGGKGTTIFVSGEAGSGKTRLSNEFLNHAKNRG